MMKKNTVVLNRISENRADMVGFCRFLNNDSVSWELLARQEIEKTKKRVNGKHILVLNDTTELNYQSHHNFLKKNDSELGPTGNNVDIGFFLHPGLAVDANTGIGLGFSAVKIWNRRWDKTTKEQRNYKLQNIQEKESYRWIECALKSKEALETAEKLTIIADRESDIYEEFVTVPDERTNLLIRSRSNRMLYDGGNLYEHLHTIKSGGQYSLKVRTTRKRKGRDTTIEIRFSRVRIRKPSVCATETKLPEWIELYVIEAKEVNKHLPENEKPISWVLLTTHPVNTFEEAFQIVKWYSMRWQIELLFATMKSKGLAIESSELESGKALKPLCIMAMNVALQINQLRQARNDQTEIPAQISFTDKQIVVLKALVKQYEGKTEKQKNHYTETSLAWAAWIIARMGGWKGYSSESPPGNKTFKAGLDRFNAVLEGYTLHENLCA